MRFGKPEGLAEPLHMGLCLTQRQKNFKAGSSAMSIQKKSLISTLKTAKKANIASAHELDAKGAKVASMRMTSNKSINTKTVSAKGSASLRSFKALSQKSSKVNLKTAKASFKAIQ
jgi:hypothetical protein